MSSIRFITDTIKGILHFTNQSATGAIPVQRNTGRPVAKGEEKAGSTVPMPSFARRPSAMSSFSPAEIPQNSVADQQRLQISKLRFDEFPTPSRFSCWKIRFKTQVSSCSGFPSETMSWIKEVELVDSVDDCKSSRSIERKDFRTRELLRYHPKLTL